MTTWDEWFTYLHGLIDPSAPCKLTDVQHFLERSESCRSQLHLFHGDLRARILDELWTAALRIIYLDLLAAEAHRRRAAALHGSWQETAGQVAAERAA